jgi:hypothetical protein
MQRPPGEIAYHAIPVSAANMITSSDETRGPVFKSSSKEAMGIEIVPR